MDDREQKKFKEHYSTLPDEKILELFNGGEAGLVAGAYGIVKEEAIKRNLLNADGTGAKRRPEFRYSLNPKLKWEKYRAERINHTYGHFLKQVFIVAIGFWVVVNIKILLSGTTITGIEKVSLSLFFFMGIPLLMSLFWMCYRKWNLLAGKRYASEQEIDSLVARMERYEYITPEDFDLWKKSSRYLPYLSYEEYLREHKKSPEMREEDRRKMEERINSPELNKIFE